MASVRKAPSLRSEVLESRRNFAGVLSFGLLGQQRMETDEAQQWGTCLDVDTVREAGDKTHDTSPKMLAST